MIKPKVKAENLPKLVRRLERTSLYISQKSSSIAYNTGIFYLRMLADAITDQTFPEKYADLSVFTVNNKIAKGMVNPHAFWFDSGNLLEEIMITKPKVVRNGNGKSSYRIEFSPETSYKIYWVEKEGVGPNNIKRPLFMPLFKQMKTIMLSEGRKFLMDAVKLRESRW